MVRHLKLLCAMFIVFAAGLTPAAQAAWYGVPKALKTQLNYINFKAPVLGPFAYTHFCMRYTEDCKVRGRSFRRPRAVALTEARWNDIQMINQRVNAAIKPKRYINDTSFDTWRIGPTQGDCNDYVVTKRHELLARGWPSRALLLAEVVTASGEHHLVLVVRTNEQDFVLDNLNANVRPWSRTGYKWVRVQSPSYANLWSTIKEPHEMLRS
jgi:predicted transglutaminase-like cysteine proteinase